MADELDINPAVDADELVTTMNLTGVELELNPVVDADELSASIDAELAAGIVAPEDLLLIEELREALKNPLRFRDVLRIMKDSLERRLRAAIEDNPYPDWVTNHDALLEDSDGYLEERSNALNRSKDELHKELTSYYETIFEVSGVWRIESDILALLYGVGEDRPSEPAAKSIQAFNVHTSQEIDAFLQSAADGKRGDNWQNDKQAGARVWNSGLAHFVRLAMTPQETDVKDLIALTESQDADSCLIALYTLNALAPERPLAAGLRRGEWLDLLDIARKTGILTREGRQERTDAIRKVWNALLYGARAEVCGQRAGTYYDKKTKQTIDTTLESSVWTFGGRERQAQAVLFGALEIPLRVEVILTKEWERLLFDASLAQYLPCGEKIGAISAGQTSGAWARMIGLALMNTWRREPQKTIYTYASKTLTGTNAPTDEATRIRLEAMQTNYEKAGALKITRREVLLRYNPARTNPIELEARPQRAIEYWLQALKHLQRRGIVAQAGEAIRTKKNIESKLPRYNWLGQWLDEVVDIRPGPAILPAIETQAKAIPKPKRRELGPVKKRKKLI